MMTYREMLNKFEELEATIEALQFRVAVLEQRQQYAFQPIQVPPAYTHPGL